MTLFSARLKWLRERMNLTQKEMAEKIGVSQQYYNKFERGTGQPNLETLFKIRHVTGESLDFIVGYYLEDEEADRLYYLFSESLRIVNDVEEDLESTQALLNRSDVDIKGLIELVRNYKEELLEARQKEERSFNLFMNYVSKIPGFEGEFLQKEFWVKKHEDFMETGYKASTELYNIYKSL